MPHTTNNNPPSPILRFLLLLLFPCFCHVSPSPLSTGGRKVEIRGGGTEKVAAVNLGGWLVIEKWIKPSIWQDIPNDDLLDGSQIQLRSLFLQTYVCAEGGGGMQVVVNRQKASDWETFKIWRHSDTVFSFRVSNNKFMSAVHGIVNATALTPKEWEQFTIIRNPNNDRQVHIRAYNKMYLQAKTANLLTADYVASSEPDWDNNAATFEMIMFKPSPYHGEYQLANGWGPEKAPAIFKNHRDTFITAADFQYLSSIGINTVRIPIGYWIASDPNPPKPFVAGSLQALDNAFDWAQSNNIKVIIDLHAAIGSQNGEEHSATIDGVSEWASGASDTSKKSYVELTLEVIDFLASRYSKHPSLYGIGLLNEPHARDIPLETLTDYFRRAYEIVRKYNTETYVIISQLLWDDPANLVNLGYEFKNAIIDLHYYNAFGPTFANMTIQQNINYIYNERRQEIRRLNQNGNGLLTFVGEWTNELAYTGASREDYQKLGQAQLEVYGEATAGWSYWNYITEEESGYLHWDFSRSYRQGYILKPARGWNA